MANTDSMLNAIAMMKQREAQERANSLNPLGAIAGVVAALATGGAAAPAIFAGGPSIPVALAGIKGALTPEGSRGLLEAGVGGYSTTEAYKSSQRELLNDERSKAKDIVGLVPDKQRIDFLKNNPSLAKTIGVEGMNLNLPDVASDDKYRVADLSNTALRIWAKAVNDSAGAVSLLPQYVANPQKYGITAQDAAIFATQIPHLKQADAFDQWMRENLFPNR